MMGRGRRSQGRPTKQTFGRAVAPWRPRQLQRDYRTLLDEAKVEPQEILDTDGSMLVVAEKGLVDFEHELAQRLAVAAQFQAAYSAHRRDEPASWAAQTPFPWLGSLEREEVAEFAQELIAYTLDAAHRRTLENLEGNLRAWRSTADIYEQPEVISEMMAAIDLDRLEEVFPPSEERARETEEG
jgi:hypothetical protein